MVRTLALLLLTASAAGQLSAQDPQSFRTGVYLTRIKVAVLDDDGAPVAGLRTHEFQLFEDGVEQDIQLVLAPRDAPLDLALVLDFSASVANEWPDPKPREAVHSLLEALEPEDCVLLMPFHSAVGPARWGSPRDQLLRRIIDTIPYGSETRLYDAIQAASRGLQRRRDNDVADDMVNERPSCTEPLTAAQADGRRAAIVVLSDGEDTGGSTQYADVLLATLQTEMPIFPVAVGMASGRPAPSRFRDFADYRRERIYVDALQRQLAELARVSGGQLVTQRDIRDGYDEVLALVRGYYVLAYPSPTPMSEGWHEVEVKVAGARPVVQPGVFRTSIDYASVRSLLRQASKLLPDEPAKALAIFRSAAAIDAQLSSPHMGRGVVLERAGLWPGARQAYEQALDLTPGSGELHSRIAHVAYQLMDYPAAWNHAIRARRAGVPTEEVLDRLRRASDPPDGLVALNAGPVVELLKPMVPDLQAQLSLRDAHRRVARLLERQPTIALARHPALVDFVVWPELRELGDGARQRLDLRLRAVSNWREIERQERIRVDDINDPDALDAATSEAVAKLAAWIVKQHADR